MLYAKYRDWTPRFSDNGYELGFAEHDDGDVVKWGLDNLQVCRTEDI